MRIFDSIFAYYLCEGVAANVNPSPTRPLGILTLSFTLDSVAELYIKIKVRFLSRKEEIWRHQKNEEPVESSMRRSAQYREVGDVFLKLFDSVLTPNCR